MTAKEFDGLAVLVTGAASGLGRATALALAAAGAKVALVDVNAAGLDETVTMAGDNAANVKAFPADLSDGGIGPKLIEDVVAAFGRIDSLCNVAGIFQLTPAPVATVVQWDRIFAVNVRAPFLLFQAALPHLLESDGTVVNVASASALAGHAYLAPYAASKGALVALTKSLAIEYIKSPLRINSVCPGPMNTPMATSGAASMPQDIDFALLMRAGGMRQMAEPEDLTDIILYLASPRNRKVHGANYVIDQGVTA